MKEQFRKSKVEIAPDAGQDVKNKKEGQMTNAEVKISCWLLTLNALIDDSASITGRPELTRASKKTWQLENKSRVDQEDGQQSSAWSRIRLGQTLRRMLLWF